MVTGSAREIGGELTSNPDVAKITFTGSTEVGKVLIRQCADTVKKVSMELGGNAPFLVFDDADLERAVDGAIAAKFRNAGQTCVCTNRLYVQAGIYDRFVEAFAAAAAKLKVGSGLEDGVMQGPLIDKGAVEKTEEFVADARDKGGRVVLGGARRDAGSLFFPPTVIADAQPSMRFSREEIFGPSRRCSGSIPKTRPSASPTTRNMASPATSTRGISGAPFASPNASNTAWSASTKGSSPPRWRRSAASSSPGLGQEGSKYGITDYLNVKYTCIGGLGF